MKHLLWLAALCSMLVGCSTDKIEILAKPIDIVIAQTADPDAVHMLPMTFKVVNAANLNQFIRDISTVQGTTTPVFIAITTTDYENFSLNIADLRRYIEQQHAVIVYYRSLTSRITPPTPPTITR